MRKVADLHLHTTASDGSWTPSELVVAAAAAGISCIAVTDHDTVDGVHEALGAGSLHGVEVIAGVELSTVLGGSEVHLLGYLIDPEHDELRSTLDVYRRERERRIHRIVDRLAGAGLILTADEVFALAGGAVPADHTSHGFWSSAGTPGPCPTPLTSGSPRDGRATWLAPGWSFRMPWGLCIEPAGWQSALTPDCCPTAACWTPRSPAASMV